MALTFKQANGSTTGVSSPHIVSFGSSNTSGSFLICAILLASTGAAAQLTGVSDPTNGAWTHLPISDTVFANSRCYVYYIPVNTATSALAVSAAFTGTASIISLGIAEYTGQATAFGPIDTATIFLDGSGTSYSANPITTQSTNESVLAFGYSSDVSGTVTGQNGFTARLAVSLGSELLDAGEATQGIYTPQLTCSVSSEFTLATVAVFSTTTQQAATPTFSPNGGSFGPAQTVTITSSTSGGTIYYTLDGSTPTHSSSSISNGGTISVSSSATVKAIASVTNFVDSAVGSASFTINGAVTTSTFAPAGGNYATSQSVTVSNADSALAGFAQYYTTDGSTPTTGSTPVSGPITVNSSLTLKVLAVATNYSNSSIASAAYVIGGGGAIGWSPVDSRQAVPGFGPGANTGIVDEQGNVIYSAQKPPFTGNSQVSDNSAIPPTDSRAAGAPVDSRASIPENSRVAPPFGGIGEP